MKNIDYIISKTAQDLDIPKETVKKIVDEYWTVAQKRMLDLKATTLYIHDVGTFTISKVKLRKFILKHIFKFRKTNYREGSTKEKTDEVREFFLTKIKKALIHRNIIATDYAKKFGNI